LESPADISRIEGAQYLYVEGGAQTAAAFLAADLVDRLEIYRAPVVIGDGLRAIAGFAPDTLDQAQGRWALTERAQLGSDSFTAYRRER
jgi:diaminohydroxyphosphoribosylaminopyrimidine deaminase/5-amino-6-(5-phosphoribosylamino)uracil reductase